MCIYVALFVDVRAPAGAGPLCLCPTARRWPAALAHALGPWPLLFLNETYSYIPKSPCKKLHSVLSVCPAQDIDEHVAVSKSQ